MTTPTKPPKVQGKSQLNVYIAPEIRQVLDTINERDGVPFSAQIDRAVRLWAKTKNVEVPHAPARKAKA